MTKIFSKEDAVTVYLLPYDNFTQKEAKAVVKDLRAKFDPLVKTKIQYEILPAAKLPASCLNGAKTRYRAMKILELEEGMDLPTDGIIMGLTHKDISTTAHGVEDFGIMGQAYLERPYCVVSDFRVRNKSNLWKVVSHEFIHTYYHYGHCPQDDPECIIKDAKGKENLPKKHHLCDVCKKNLNSKY
ncbi:MAG: hypothetical protein Q4B68_03915 [Bacteroidales bacterium]|nr:hypothetical protein [Bacteroidales bacterium]